VELTLIVLEIRQLHKAFDGVKAVNEVTLSASRGTVTSIIGPNGAGKTTLFSLIDGFIRPDSGSISYKGNRIDALRPSRRAQLGIGRLWQDVRLFGKMSVLENLLVARKKHPGESVVNCLFRPRLVSQAEKDNRTGAEQILEFVGLKDKMNALAQDLSYGQQKLVALVRLLNNDAELLLLDEPTAGVHPSMIEEILVLIRKLAKDGKTVLMIEHNVPKARLVSDFIYVMDRGRIEMETQKINARA
jgi:ABC-type branched-subunit amino acid transport system ATPase component